MQYPYVWRARPESTPRGTNDDFLSTGKYPTTDWQMRTIGLLTEHLLILSNYQAELGSDIKMGLHVIGSNGTPPGRHSARQIGRFGPNVYRSSRSGLFFVS
jgi:hypothetical protein